MGFIYARVCVGLCRLCGCLKVPFQIKFVKSSCNPHCPHWAKECFLKGRAREETRIIEKYKNI